MWIGSCKLDKLIHVKAVSLLLQVAIVSRKLLRNTVCALMPDIYQYSTFIFKIILISTDIIIMASS